MKCKETHEKLFEYVDGSLSRSESAALRLHLEECSTCREIVQCEMDRAHFISSGLERAVAEVRLDRRAQRHIAEMAAKKLARSRGSASPPFWMRLAWSLAAAGMVVVLIIGVKSRLSSRPTSPPALARVSMPLVAPEISMNLKYTIPSYAFHRDGNTVVDALVSEPCITDASLIVKN